ncbi:MAG: class I SAM-dependent DNA methyltransferase [Candidatus Heimdallarchaeota archaeon]
MQSNSESSKSGYIRSGFPSTAVITPEPIVDFMIDQVRQRIETWQGDLRELKILEPSCGPGSFLIRLYHILKNEYSKRDARVPLRKRDLMHQSEIYSPLDDPLLCNLYGIDINPKAIVLAKNNLTRCRMLLDPEAQGITKKFLSDPPQTIHQDAQKSPLSQTLSSHLKVGDFLFDDTKITSSALIWAKEFPEVFTRNNPGFDIIIGNPPYSVDRNLPLNYREALKEHYGQFYRRQTDLYIPFVPRAFELVRQNGLICFIIQHSILAAKVTKPLREFLLETSKIHLIVDFGKFRRKIFNTSKVQVLPTILLFEKGTASEDWQTHCILTTRDPIIDNGLREGLKVSFLPQEYYKSQPLKVFQTSDVRRIENQIKGNCIELGQIYDIQYGLSLRPLRNLLHDQKIKNWEDFCFLHTRGDFVRPYSDRRPCTPQYYLLLDIHQYSDAIGKEVRKGQGGASLDHFIHPHLLIRRVAMKRVEATYFDGQPVVLANDSVLIATPRHFLKASHKDGKKTKRDSSKRSPGLSSEEYDPLLILAVINSAPVQWLYQQTMSVDLAIYPRFVKRFPIPNPHSEKAKEVMKKAQRLLKLNYQKNELFRIFDKALIREGLATEEFYWTGSKSMSKNKRKWTYVQALQCFNTPKGNLLKLGKEVFERLDVNQENLTTSPPSILCKGRILELGTPDLIENDFLVSHRFIAKSVGLATFLCLLFLKQKREAASQANWQRPERYFKLPGRVIATNPSNLTPGIDHTRIRAIKETINVKIAEKNLGAPFEIPLIDEEIQILRTEIDKLILDLWGIENEEDRERILTQEFGE